jgi:hypothetical protein
LCRIEGLIQEDRRIRVSDNADELNISVGDYKYEGKSVNKSQKAMKKILSVIFT